jgi:hypothetical protein
LVHLLQEHLLAGFLDDETEVQGGLFHDTNSLNRGLH